MEPAPLLQDRPIASASRVPDRRAIVEPGWPELSFRTLFGQADRARNALQTLGVQPGDRVGIYLPKSADAVIAILATLKTGAAYVPIDPQSPPARAGQILSDCGVRALWTEAALVERLKPHVTGLAGGLEWLVLDHTGGGTGLAAWLEARGSVPEGRDVRVSPESAAYLLYTSGSTGKPKGVVVSHRAATRFVQWCSDTFGYAESDRFSSHAPLHFDLSIHDLFVSLSHGASVVLIGEELGKDPVGLAALIQDQQLTVWYSTPTILSLLAEHGRLDRSDARSLRCVLFAGEVFPIPKLRRLLDAWPEPRYFNLYGPTETNVCTWHEVVERDPEAPLPIGRICPHFVGRVVDAGDTVPAGCPGELWIAGDGVMSGYWGRPDLDANVFVDDPAGRRWYRTGDLVSQTPDGILRFHGRRDRMVKRRGYRIELGEIEAGLSRHPAIAHAAALAVPDPASGVTIRAFLVSSREGRPSVIDLKRFCMEELPRYMVPDRFVFLDQMPQTSTGKTDYQALTGLAP